VGIFFIEEVEKMQTVPTPEVCVRQFNKNDIDVLTEIVNEAWSYYVQEINRARIKELLEFYINDDTTRFWIAFEEGVPVGVAQVVVRESFRCFGEEGRLELLYIKDTASNYYDVHSALMDEIFKYLRLENIEYLRIDTTLENADILFI
jgi:hypothetical protein